MIEFLDNISIQYLLIIAVVMALAPFQPEPHLFEKIRMLKEGSLTRPLDIFDLFFHSVPILILIIKLIRVYFTKA